MLTIPHGGLADDFGAGGRLFRLQRVEAVRISLNRAYRVHAKRGPGTSPALISLGYVLAAVLALAVVSMLLVSCRWRSSMPSNGSLGSKRSSI